MAQAAAAPTLPAVREAAEPELDPSPYEAPAVVAAEPAVPAGQLVCRSSSREDGATELYLEWKNETGKGLLRRRAPSGMLYEQTVEAERGDGIIVVDRPGNDDLTDHAAVIRVVNGKPHIRIGDRGHSWSTCE